MTPEDKSIEAAKAVLRQAMERDRSAAKRQNPDAALALRDQALQALSVPQGQVIASYVAYGGEIDPQPLADALRERGCRIVLPIVTEKNTSLQFRLHVPDVSLVPGYRNIPEPPPAAAILEPDILLVPFLAFDRAKRRLGRGGGYYDRTLTALRGRKPVLAVGVGFACQEVPEVPHRPHDAKLDKVATEIQVF